MRCNFVCVTAIVWRKREVISNYNRMSSTGMKPLKKVEIPLNKFNDVAVPHHVDLLKKHKSNIEKFQLVGDYDRVHREQINATRTVKQLKALLSEIDVLRNQVQDSDLDKFDKLTAVARETASSAIKEYFDLNPQKLSPIWPKPRDDEGVCESSEEDIPQMLQIKQSMSIDELVKQEACLKSWEDLQSEVKDVHELFEDFARVVKEQKEKVDIVEENVEETAENVTKGATALAKAAKYKTVAYPIAGAVIGTCLGGPVGFLAGLKLGGLAALSGGVIGFTGGQMLKKKRETEIRGDVELLTLQQSRNAKGSVSLPHIPTTS